MNVIRWIWRQLWVTAVMALVLLALYTSIGRQLMPLLETKQADIEAWLSSQLQLPVVMTSIKGDWHALSPVLRIENLNLAGEQGITLKNITAELDLSASIFYRTPVFNRVSVSGVSGHFTQRSKQEWQLAPDWLIHLNTSTGEQSSYSAEVIASWLSLQQYILLSDIEVTLNTLESQVDSQVDSLDLRQLRWRSRGGQHELNADLSWGREKTSSVRIQAFLDGDLLPWNKQHGRVYVNLEEQDWSSWLAQDEDLAVSVKQLQGTAQGWLNIRSGNLESVYLTSDITKITLALAGDELTLSDGTLLLAGKHNNNDWHLQLLPEFAQTLPFNSIQLSEVSIGQQKGWQIGVPELNIQQARTMLERYKLLPEKIAYFIDGTAPVGTAKDVRFSVLKKASNNRWQFDVRALLEGIHSDAFHGIPAISDLDAELHLQPLAGTVKFTNQSLKLYLPDLYGSAWRFKQFDGLFRWAMFDDHAELLLENARATVQDNTAEKQYWPLSADMKILLPRHSEAEPSLSLLLAAPEAPIVMHQLFVPDLIGEAALDWLAEADLTGTAYNVAFALQTEIGEGHPLNSSSSLLSLDFNAADLTYLPQWPRVHQLAGSLFLDSSDLSVNITAGETLGGQLSQGSAQLRNHKLQLQTRINGNSSEGFSYFTQTPLQEAVNHALDGWKAEGEMAANLKVGLDFQQTVLEPQVDLVAEFENNRLFLSELNLQLSKLTGRIHYSSDAGLQSDLLEGQVLGGPFKTSLSSVIDSDKHMSIVLQGKGNAAWQAFHNWQKLSIFTPIQGRLDYNINLLLTGEETLLQINSDLLGTEVKLPEPFTKTADQPRSLKVQIEPGRTSILSASYDQKVKAKLALTSDQLPRGQIVLGGQGAQLSSQSGIEIRGSVDAAVVAEQWWQSYLDLTEMPAIGDNDKIDQANETIRSVDLTLNELHAFDVPLGSTHVRVQPSAHYWQSKINSPVVKGLIDIPIGDAPILLNLDYLLLPEPDPIEEEAAHATVDRLADIVPVELPAMEASIKEFFVGGRNYGRWQLNSQPIENGVEVNIVEGDLYGLNIKGQLQWLLVAGQHRTYLNELMLKSTDVGAIQRGFRLVPVVEGKKLTGRLNLSWLGSPLALNAMSLEGSSELHIENGFLMTEDSKALKALGALNFKSVSRRLKLDFSDLYQEGVSFDDLHLSGRFEDGIMTLTEPMRVDGPGGKFLTSGYTNLIDHSLNMKVAITLPVTNNLPLVAILAGLSPPIAASIYVTEKLIGDELSRFTSASYSLTGTWEEPDMKIKKAFDDSVEGKKRSSLKDRIMSIFGR